MNDLGPNEQDDLGALTHSCPSLMFTSKMTSFKDCRMDSKLDLLGVGSSVYNIKSILDGFRFFCAIDQCNDVQAPRSR